jgi:hypothetical protein
MTVQPGLHSLYKAGSSGTISDLRNGRTGFATGFAPTRFTAARFAGRARRFPAVLRAPDRFVRVARIFSARSRDSHFIAGFLASVILQSQNYFLLSTMCLSVRLLWRVFLPSVGKAQGV